MKDDACICFLQWALPLLHMRWPGFRKVRGQVCKRLARRLEELQLANLKDYRSHLLDNPLEWHILDSMCRITISRFYRDRGVYNNLQSQIFPELIDNAKLRGDKNLSCWCIGGASGEEPYSVSLLWELSGLERKGIDLKILATEVDQAMINRARVGCYPASSIRELPALMMGRAFSLQGGRLCLKEKYKERVHFLQQDIRNEQPAATFDLILCRNLVFTYFSEELQEEIGQEIIERLTPGGFLVLGTHERFPKTLKDLTQCLQGQSIIKKEGGKISRDKQTR